MVSELPSHANHHVVWKGSGGRGRMRGVGSNRMFLLFHLDGLASVVAQFCFGNIINESDIQLNSFLTPVM